MIICLSRLFSAQAQLVRSFMHMETVGQSAQGPVYASPTNSALWVEWSNDMSTCHMLDNTVWRLQGSDMYGNIVYVYAGSSGPTMPMTTYQRAVFSADKMRMQVFYVFGMMGMYTQMAATYNYIGEDTEPAYNCITGNY